MANIKNIVHEYMDTNKDKITKYDITQPTGRENVRTAVSDEMKRIHGREFKSVGTTRTGVKYAKDLLDQVRGNGESVPQAIVDRISTDVRAYIDNSKSDLISGVNTILNANYSNYFKWVNLFTNSTVVLSDNGVAPNLDDYSLDIGEIPSLASNNVLFSDLKPLEFNVSSNERVVQTLKKSKGARFSFKCDRPEDIEYSFQVLLLAFIKYQSYINDSVADRYKAIYNGRLTPIFNNSTAGLNTTGLSGSGVKNFTLSAFDISKIHLSIADAGIINPTVVMHPSAYIQMISNSTTYLNIANLNNGNNINYEGIPESLRSILPNVLNVNSGGVITNIINNTGSGHDYYNPAFTNPTLWGLPVIFDNNQAFASKTIDSNTKYYTDIDIVRGSVGLVQTTAKVLVKDAQSMINSDLLEMGFAFNTGIRFHDMTDAIDTNKLGVSLKDISVDASFQPEAALVSYDANNRG